MFSRILCIFLMTILSSSAQAVLVEYRFTGELTGDVGSLFSAQTFVNTPFQVSILADTSNVSFNGYIAGAGKGYSNNGSTASWSVAGFGSTSLSNVQVYSLPGLGRIGFVWGGKDFYFNGNEIAMDSAYGHLSSVVEPITVTLQASLQNPPNALPEYPVSINFDSLGLLTLQNLISVKYAIVAVPEPSNVVLLLAGLVGVAVASKRQRKGIE